LEQKDKRSLLADWKLHVVVLLLVMITEAIGIHKIPVGPGIILLLPMLYAMILGLILYFTRVVGDREATAAEPIIILSITYLIAKIGVLIGPNLPKIIAAGPALILQEFGNLGTILLALPVALLLGFKRETIGMTHSVGREPNVGLIVDLYGFNSPEGRGVLAVYVVGTLLGAIFMGLFAGFMATILPLHPLSFAMATGIGSGSMMTAASGSLAAVFPEMADDILAFAGASNLLTTATGLYMSIFIGLPMANWLYKVLGPRIQGSRFQADSQKEEK